MLATTLLQPILFLLLALLTRAAPLENRAKAVSKNFYLLAAPKKTVNSKHAIGLNLVDPFSGPDFFLRRQEGAGSYSQFNLTHGMLTTLEFPPRNVTARVTFESTVDESTGEVIFHQEEGTKGLLSFDGKFLAYKDDVSGFTACEGELSQTIIVYNGTDASCEKVYIFQQLTAPSSTF